MGYASESGYTPQTIEEILDAVRLNVNEQFSTTYTAESFVGTNFYKYAYAIAQRLQENEIKASEIFVYLQQYFAITNERISRPVNTSPGIIEKLETEGYIASVKPPSESDAGKLFVCVDVDETDDEYADTQLEINTIIKDSVAAGIVTMGDQTDTIALSNGQSFDFSYNLPNRIPVALRLTLTLSENNMVMIDSPETVKQTLIDNIEAKYRLGRNFEPQTYFSVADAPWCSQVLLEWTDDVTDGVIDESPTWESDLYDADYDDLFVISLALIEVVEE
jgi:hypothetical protein